MQDHNSPVVHSHNQSIDWRLLIQGQGHGHDNTDRRKQHTEAQRHLSLLFYSWTVQTQV